MNAEDKEAMLKQVADFLDKMDGFPIISLRVLGSTSNELEICTDLIYEAEFDLAYEDRYEYQEAIRRQITWAYSDENKVVTLIDSIREL